MLLFPQSYGHNSFAFGAHLNADGTTNLAYINDTVVIDRRRIRKQYREGRDAYHLGTGGSLGRAHKGLGLIELWGRILVPDTTQNASRSDRERAFLAAFDPELCYKDSPSTDGAYAFDFSEATTDTATYPTGRIPLRYYCRPTDQPSVEERLTDGTVLDWAMVLIAADPRAYEQTEQSLELTPAAASGAVLNRGTAPAPLKATILMGGAGATNFTITRGGVSFVLDLSSTAAGQSVVVVMDTCAPYGQGRKITKAGADAFSLKTSTASTWLDVPVGSTTFSISNHTNVTSCTLAWYSARA